MSRTIALAGVIAAIVTTGCQEQNRVIVADNPEVGAYLSLLLPRKVEIQRSLTRPQSFDGTGNENGVEVVLAVTDSFGDETKCVGTFNFELYQAREASGDRLGTRIGFWQLKVDSDASMREVWDRWSRFYRFRLKSDERILPPGRYVLTAQLIGPTGDKLFDEYAFAHGGSGATRR